MIGKFKKTPMEDAVTKLRIATSIEPLGGDEWISIGPGTHKTEAELGEWQQEIHEWCNENLSEEFYCDWEFGAAQGVQADWYLFCKFGNRNDRVMFILRWG